MNEKFIQDFQYVRISLGISFAFQSFGWVGFSMDKIHQGVDFILPLINILDDNNILLIGGIDGFPEVDLVSPKYNQEYSAFIAFLVLFRRFIQKAFGDYQYCLRLFNFCKQNVVHIHNVSESYIKNRFINQSIVKIDDIAYFYYFREPCPYTNISSAEKEKIKELNQKAIWIISGEFVKFFSMLHPSWFKYMKKYLEEDNFFEFLLFYTQEFWIRGLWLDSDLIPNYQPIHLKYLANTIFDYKSSGFVVPILEGTHINPRNFASILIAQLQIMTGDFSANSLNYARNLEPSRIYKLLKSTLSKTISSIGTLTEIAKQDVELKIDVRIGIACIPFDFYTNNTDLVKIAISKGFPIIICASPSIDIQNIFHGLIGGINLDLGMSVGSFRRYGYDIGNDHYLFSTHKNQVEEVFYHAGNRDIKLF